MLRTALTYAETLVFIAAVSVPVHYLAGLDWPWAIVIGAAVSIVLRRLIHGTKAVRAGKPRTSGGR